ncbi:HEPN domain-containing protein [Brevibacterium casei]|uniref:HEPN domain-containing protein n=1 Tax=Brevibacterium casei TaxID=33889 RepID=A0A269ZGN6_9MICO|nr:HEPN domain-containing protein [Brevibacterium casei]PAK96660.1 hypothetical protein B8X04_04945 [Brevibacterium casei]QPS32783.1 HEPN domain-containing protein [Brevibacterium casei]
MARSEQQNPARLFLRKAQEYLDSAEDNLVLERLTVAGGDAVHAGICAKDAIVTALSGTTGKAKDHSRAARELRDVLGSRPVAADAERCLRQLVSAKSEIEYGTGLMSEAKAETLVRRARTVVATAKDIVVLRR